MAQDVSGRGVGALINLIERRFDLVLDTSDNRHLAFVQEHYREKRELILRERGEAAALSSDDYAKAVLLSETARMALREIAPRRRKKNRKG